MKQAKNIVYLNNFLSMSSVKARNNERVYSQAANNKITGVLKSLQAAGHHVTVVSNGFVNRKNGKKYIRMEETYEGAKVIYSPILDIPFINSISSAFYMYKEIKRLHKKRKIDNIIFYNYKIEAAWPALLAKKMLHIPITVEHEDEFLSMEIKGIIKKAMYTLTERVIIKEVDSAIVSNSELKAAYSVPVAVVRGVVDMPFYMECRQQTKRKSEKPVILYSGGLDHERGIDVLLESLGFLDEDCRVVVTGKGRISTSDKRVEFLGFVSHEDVKKYMRNADILVQCQLVNSDFSSGSFPSKLFEYIATGNLVVSSDIRDVREFAGDAFLYYENDDPRELARILKEHLHDENRKRAEMEALCEKNTPEAIGSLMTSEILI